MACEPVLTRSNVAFLESARRAVLVTLASDGRPRLVPICFVLAADAPILYTPLDDKPKRSDDPLALARVRDIAADPRVSVLVDRWDEDWTRLAWLRAEGRRASSCRGRPGSSMRGRRALRATYPQYETHRLDDRPVIRVTIERVTDWGSSAGAPRRPAQRSRKTAAAIGRRQWVELIAWR